MQTKISMKNSQQYLSFVSREKILLFKMNNNVLKNSIIQNNNKYKYEVYWNDLY